MKKIISLCLLSLTFSSFAQDLKVTCVLEDQSDFFSKEVHRLTVVATPDIPFFIGAPEFSFENVKFSALAFKGKVQAKAEVDEIRISSVLAEESYLNFILKDGTPFLFKCSIY